MLWADSTCEYASRLSLLTHHPYTVTASWEYFTTLEYEWSVLRGHRPYRWTIWVRRYMRSPSFPLPQDSTAPVSWADLFVDVR